MYRIWLRPFGFADELCVYLEPPTGEARTFTFTCRGPRAFGERERVLLQLLRPHLSILRNHFELRISTPFADTDARLTPREAEVLGWVARGKTNKEIAGILSVSPHTVRTQLEHVFEKLDVHTRTAAVARAQAVLSADGARRRSRPAGRSAGSSSASCREDARRELDPLGSRVRAPLRRIGPLGFAASSATAESSAAQSASRHVAEIARPQKRVANGPRPAAEQRPQILRDVAVPAVDVRRAAGVRVVAAALELRASRSVNGPSTGREHGVGELRPGGVHDRGARSVDLAVAVRVDPARPGSKPLIEQNGRLLRKRRRVDVGAGVEHGADQRPPRDGAQILRRRLVHRRGDVASVCFFTSRSSAAAGDRRAGSSRTTKFESAAPTSAAGLLFQLRITPLGGSIACGCCAGAGSPATRTGRLPIVGSAGSVPGARTGRRPLEK